MSNPNQNPFCSRSCCRTPNSEVRTHGAYSPPENFCVDCWMEESASEFWAWAELPVFWAGNRRKSKVLRGVLRGKPSTEILLREAVYKAKVQSANTYTALCAADDAVNGAVYELGILNMNFQGILASLTAFGSGAWMGSIELCAAREAVAAGVRKVDELKNAHALAGVAHADAFALSEKLLRELEDFVSKTKPTNQQ